MWHRRAVLLSFALTCGASPYAHGQAAQPTSSPAVQALSEALKADPKNNDAYWKRAGLYAEAGEHQLAIADYDALVKLDPQRAEAYDRRGSQHFMLGHIQQSIDDFDRFIKLRPEQEAGHWRRGISYYYAGRWDDGRRQFEGYQTVDDNDVENAVWRYLCMARGQSPQAARGALLKIRHDARVPMMEVYALFGGQAGPDEVLAAARAGSPPPELLNVRLFYAHLYLGLFAEAAGDAAGAKEHITIAAEKHKVGHYMWHVADVHAKMLQSAKQK